MYVHVYDGFRSGLCQVALPQVEDTMLKTTSHLQEGCICFGAKLLEVWIRNDGCRARDDECRSFLGPCGLQFVAGLSASQIMLHPV